MNTPRISGSAVVARFVDGRVLKGTTQDFAAQKPIFHLSVWGEPTARAIPIPVGALKALFFVRTFEGDPQHVDDRDIAKAKGPGRRIIVTFADGELLCGLTAGYSKDKQGFFVIPVDQDANNARVFVVTEAVKKVEWADNPSPARILT
jgi:hypothetical protein